MGTTDTQEWVEVNPLTGSNCSRRVPIPPSFPKVGDAHGLAKRSLWRILTAKDGDKRVVWDASDLAQIQDARRMFEELKAAGMVAYKVGDNGLASTEVMEEFDPLAEEVLFLPVGKQAGLLVGG